MVRHCFANPLRVVKDDDPVRVGKSNGIDIRQAIASLHHSFKRLEVGQGKPLCVVISGIHQRVPAAAGIYKQFWRIWESESKPL